MRGTAVGLGNPHPLAGTLPAMLGHDDFVQRMCAGFDEVLAPVFATLDCFPDYLDPRTVPEDMLGWLAAWIGLGLEAGEPPERCRARLVDGSEQLGRRGTVRGIVAAVESAFGVLPEIVETGGAVWSATSGRSMPGSPGARLLVRLRVPDAALIDLVRLDALVAAVKPAHVPHQIEVEGDPVPEPPAPEPASRPFRPVPPARHWEPSVRFAPEGTPVVSFVIHEEDPEGNVVAVSPGGTRSVEGPSGNPPRGEGAATDGPSADATPDGEEASS